MTLSAQARSHRARLITTAAAVVLIVAMIGIGFNLRGQASEWEQVRAISLGMEAEVHEIDAAALDALAHGKVDLMGRQQMTEAIHELRELTVDIERTGLVAVGGLKADVERFIRASEEFVEGVDASVATESLTSFHDLQVRPAYIEVDRFVDDMVVTASEKALTYRENADFTSLAEIMGTAVVAAAVAGSFRKVEEARRSVQEKDRFIASVSHELRTPLTAVVGMAQVLADDEDIGDDLRTSLALDIAAQGRDLANLIDDLLVAARTEMSEISIVPGRVHLGEEVATAVETIGDPTARTIGIRCDEEVLAHADPLRTRQIVRNLITNSIRYGGEDRTVQVTNGSGFAHVHVSDNGPAISKDAVEKMFQPYSRGQSNTAIGSVGLGLSVSRALARRMRGDVTFSRAYARNTFTLSLPLASEQLRPTVERIPA